MVGESRQRDGFSSISALWRSSADGACLVVPIYLALAAAQLGGAAIKLLLGSYALAWVSLKPHLFLLIHVDVRIEQGDYPIKRWVRLQGASGCHLHACPVNRSLLSHI